MKDSKERAHMHAMLLESDPYLSCDDCFEQVDQSVENILSGKISKRELSEEFRVHLKACGACEEEAFALAEVAAPLFGISEEEAIAKLSEMLFS